MNTTERDALRAETQKDRNLPESQRLQLRQDRTALRRKLAEQFLQEDAAEKAGNPYIVLDAWENCGRPLNRCFKTR